MKQKRKFLAWLLLLAMVFTSIPAIPAKAEVATDKVINALDYGVDPTGETDSTEAIWEALQAAKEAEADGSSVTLVFPEGEYHIYKDYAQKRNYHTSNTNSIENPVKTIGLLIEDHENLTVEGNGSLVCSYKSGYKVIDIHCTVFDIHCVLCPHSFVLI